MDGYEIAIRVFLLYVIICYLVLAPGLVMFLIEKHTDTEKTLQALAFFLCPVMIPFYLAGVAMVGLLCFAFMIVAYPVYWIKIHLRFWLLKKWLQLAMRILEPIRKILTALLGLYMPAPTKKPYPAGLIQLEENP
jgi:hypothetical protein